MRCPKCNQWNRASLPKCIRCGTPLATDTPVAPSWRAQLKDGHANEYIRVDEDGEISVSPDEREVLAAEMTELKARKEAGEELQRRLDAIDVDGVLATGIIEAGIADRPRSMFPQVIHTERPDRFARLLLNGRVGLIVDGIPIAFLVPVSLPEYLRVPQEDSQNYLISSALSLVRWMAVVLALALPAFYAAIAMYHQEMIPSKLLLSIIQSKQDVPFSTALEITGMLIAFELLQEAGLRLPNPIGDTVSVIGALIVGQSAVEAKVISPIAVIVVATAGIAGYAQPSQDLGAALRLCRLALLIAAIIGGLYGVAAGLCLFVWYLCTIDSYGRNYTAPWSGRRPDNLSQTFLRKPPSADKLREAELNCPDRRKRS